MPCKENRSSQPQNQLCPFLLIEHDFIFHPVAAHRAAAILHHRARTIGHPVDMQHRRAGGHLEVSGRLLLGEDVYKRQAAARPPAKPTTSPAAGRWTSGATTPKRRRSRTPSTAIKPSPSRMAARGRTRTIRAGSPLGGASGPRCRRCKATTRTSKRSVDGAGGRPGQSRPGRRIFYKIRAYY